MNQRLIIDSFSDVTDIGYDCVQPVKHRRHVRTYQYPYRTCLKLVIMYENMHNSLPVLG